MTVIERACPAKVNLALSVGPRDDRGMHPIASWVVAADFADTLKLERSGGGRSSFILRWADDAPRPQTIDWPLERDLAYRAHALLEQELGRTLPVRATLTKRVPTGAGLGGGSSNAAAMTGALNELFDLGMGRGDLVELSRRLGSDIAFFASGASGALVTGLGEHIEPLPPRRLHLVLILPPLHCPTAAVYRAFDHDEHALDEARVRALTGLDPLPPDALFNDLAEPAMTVEPKLAGVRRRVGHLLEQPVHVTGSGAALFLVAPDHPSAEAWADRIRGETTLPALAAQTLTD